ncbi:MAG TPA: YCF48-related protein [Bacteroidota bacterium]
MKHLILTIVMLVLFTGFGIAQPTLSGVQFIDASSAVAVGTSGTVVRSNDGGVTWFTQQSGTIRYLFSVSFANSSEGTAVGGDPVSGILTIIHTANSGSSWSSQSAPVSQPLVAVSFCDASNGFAVGYGGTILHTVNGGATWVSQTTGVLSTLNGVACIDANTAVIVGDFGVIMRTTNGGGSWSQSSSGTANDLYGVRFLNSTTGWAVGLLGTIVKTTNGGSSWSAQSSGTTNILNAVSFADASNGWAVGNGGVILHSSNGGSSWSSQSLAIANWADVSFISSSTGLVVGDHGTTIIRTVNGGSSWTTQTVGGGNPPPAAPVLSSPSNGASNQATSLTLSWNASSGASSYRVQASTSSSFSTLFLDDSTVTTTSRAIGSMANNTTYYWRVNAKSTNGTSGWSSVFSFTTLPLAPGAFSLSSPSNGATVQPVSGTLSWGSSANATGYDVYLGTTNPPTTVVSTNQAGTSYSYSLLSNGTTYYWNVVAKNGGGNTSATGGPWSFATAVAAPAVPVPSLPANGATNQPTSLSMSWAASAGAASYRVQVSTSSAFSTFVLDDSTVTGTSRAVSSLSNNSTYYWRVNAKNTGGTSGWSAVCNFTTVPLLPAVVTAAAGSVTTSSATVNGTVNPNGASTTAWFEWGTSSTLSTFTATTAQSVGSGTSASAVSANLTGLSLNTTYYYRAAGQNSGGTQKDVILSFTTGANLPTVTTTSASSVTTSSATMNGTVNPNGVSTTGWFEWGTSNTLSTFTATTAQSVGSGTSASPVSANLTGLSANTTYYYRAAGQNVAGTQKDAILSFTTGANPPTVTTTAASSVTTSSATMNGTVNPNGVSTTGWFEWGTSSTLSTFTSTSAQSVGSGTTAAPASANLTGLSANTTYYFRAAGQNSGGTQKGTILSFTTGANSPSVTTTAASSVTTSSATMNGSVNPNGASTTAWFEWGTSSTLSTLTATTAQSVGSGTSASPVSANLTGLNLNTTYYYRAAGQNSGGTQKDAILSFTTGANLPTVTTTAASSVTTSSATMNGTVNPNGVSTTAWFEWGTSSTLSAFTATTAQSLGSGTSASPVSANLTALTANTTYYYRAAGQNVAGTQKDAILSFTTGANAPSVTTTAASSVTTSSATMNGSVNPNGVSTTAWFEWGTSSTLSTFTSTTAQSVGSGTSASPVSANLTGLSLNTTYYYRVAGQNSGGTQKDGILSFTTGANLPTVTTTAASSVTTSSATMNGTVNPNGVSTTAWFEWGTSSTLSTFTSTTAQSAGSGTSASPVSASLSALSANTTYYYRVAGQNVAGTQKDAILSFTTSANLPTVATTSAGSVTASSATMNGTVNPNGAATTAWFEWGTSSTLTTFTATTAQSAGSGTIASLVSANLTALSANTTYYYRIAAQNSGGTQKDGILSFTTSANPPTVATAAAGSVTSSSATLNGTVNPNGALTTAWFEWGTSSTLSSFSSTSGQSVGSGTSASPVSANLTGLSLNTTYYFRVAGQNSGGTQKDAILSFTTGTNPPSVTTMGASSVTTSSAVTNGSVNPNGSPTMAWFEWGTSSTLSSFTSTSQQSVGSGTTATPVSANLTGLSLGTTYYYRAAGQNSGGTQKNTIMSFTTGVNPPTVATSAASSVTTSSATMNGTVNPNGAAATAWFEWGTSSTLSTFTSTTAQSVGSGTTDASVSANLTSLNANTTYYYRVAGQNSGGTQRDGILSFTTGANPPAVVTTAATSVTSGSATVNGTVNPNGVSTVAWFEWGTSSTLSTYSSTSAQSMGSGTSASLASANLNSLSANTTYYYRVAAQNGGGTQKDAILSFTTGANPPTVATTAAGSVTTNSATLNGTVNPNGALATAWFEWGTSSTLSTFASTSAQSVGSGTSDSPVSANLTGLSVNTTYYFRVAGQNSGGTQKDAILSFTTLDAPPAAPSPSSPANGATGLATSPTLSWAASAGASSYRCQLSTDPAFGTMTEDDSNLTATSDVVGPLAFNTTYYWRVNATNGAGTSSWSLTCSFTTAGGAPSFSVNPTSLNFGTVVIGTPLKDSVTVSNSGSGTLTIDTIYSLSTKYKVSPSNASVPAGGSQLVYVTFTPTNKNAVTSAIVFKYNGAGSPDSLPVTGKGGSAPRVRKNTTVINFGPVAPGSMKMDSFSLYNVTSSNVVISSVVSTDTVFSVTPTSATIPPADSQWFDVSATPLSEQQSSGYIIVNYADGSTPDSIFVQTDQISGVKIIVGRPAEFALRQNYPNPFNPATTIRFELPEASIVTLTVYNILGQELTKLADGEMEAGVKTVVWNTSDQNIGQVPSGVYFYRLSAKGLHSGVEFGQVMKMTLIK